MMASLVLEKPFEDSQPSNAASRPMIKNDNQNCPFCRIAILYPPYDPTSPPMASSPSISPALASPNPETYIILSTPLTIAFLDIMPLSQGHLLVCSRRHAPKLTDTTPAEARELGYHVRLLSAALSRATGVEDWNVVQNNGAAAAQVVQHIHYHVIPRPELRAQGRWRDHFTMFGRGRRTNLDPEDGERLAERLREELMHLLRQQDDGFAKSKL